jgi:fructose-1,6-bisphosphatase/sedoheptulose 1,7-bisphosphatase-like protein
MVIDKKYIDPFILATERAAYGASLFKGKEDKMAADQSAVDEMRNQLNKINMKGRIVIGEGELDEAPMLYIGEKVGNNSEEELDIAVDPLEGTNFTAKNLPNALSVLAVAKKGNLLHAPDIYMEKIAIGAGFPAPYSPLLLHLGIGGGPEGVLAAAALSCLNCQMQTRLSFQNEDEKNRSRNMGINDLNQKYNIDDMIKGDVIFCATGVTDGDLVKGIKDHGDSFEAETYVLHKSSNTNKKIIHKIKK